LTGFIGIVENSPRMARILKSNVLASRWLYSQDCGHWMG